MSTRHAPTHATQNHTKRVIKKKKKNSIKNENHIHCNCARIDGPEKMNTISGEFRQEIEDIWSDEIADDASVKAVVFISGKPDNYIAGADIRMISATKDKADLKQVKGVS